QLVDEAVRSMRTLNRAAADALRALPVGAVRACTDITGFGLAGHGTELARASGVTLAIDARRLPTFTDVAGLAAQNRSGGLVSNQEFFGGGITFAAGVDPGLELLLFDPQTSGGLLIAVDPALAGALEAALLTFSVH